MHAQVFFVFGNEYFMEPIKILYAIIYVFLIRTFIFIKTIIQCNCTFIKISDIIIKKREYFFQIAIGDM